MPKVWDSDFGEFRVIPEVRGSGKAGGQGFDVGFWIQHTTVIRFKEHCGLQSRSNSWCAAASSQYILFRFAIFDLGFRLSDAFRYWIPYNL